MVGILSQRIHISNCHDLNILLLCHVCFTKTGKYLLWAVKRMCQKNMRGQKSRKMNDNLEYQLDDLVGWQSGKLVHSISHHSHSLLSQKKLYVFSSWLFFIFPVGFLIISRSGMLIRQTLNSPKMTFKMTSWRNPQDSSPNLHHE